MSVKYQAVQWSKHKRVYDGVAAALVLVYVATFMLSAKVLWTGANAISDEVLIIRATGSCALLLLHVILCIGPLARLDRRFLPILANRRHLGVMTFAIALIHAVIVTGYYHGFGDLNPLLSLLISNTNYASLRAFPFEALGLGALLILFLLAATSHDFWLQNLGSATWKRLHMLVYVAYALLIGHVALGALRRGTGGTADVLLMAMGILVVSGLHIAAGLRERHRDAGTTTDGDWIDAGTPDEIPDGRAKVVCSKGGERIAVFKHNGAISAVTNVCAHQGGPLGEGRVIDGCITCPWHGWQYRPVDGCSPPPFTEKIATYPVRLVNGRVQVAAKSLAPGTPTTPLMLHGSALSEGAQHG